MGRPVFGANSRTSNPMPSGIGNGTPGGMAGGARGMNMNSMRVGDEGYLWLLVGLEIFLMCCLRNHFKRYHGG